jgi:hypothetical protein
MGTLLAIWIFWIIAFGSLCGWLAGEKGRSGFNWFCLGAFFGIFALLVVGFAPSVAKPEPEAWPRNRGTGESSLWRSEALDQRSPNPQTVRPERVITCPSCRAAVAPAEFCSSCGEPFAGGGWGSAAT